MSRDGVRVRLKPQRARVAVVAWHPMSHGDGSRVAELQMRLFNTCATTGAAMSEISYAGAAALLAVPLTAYSTAAILARKFVPSKIEEGSRVNCIDGLRGYLAISVLAFHFIMNWNLIRLGRWEDPTWSVVLTNIGPVPVRLFFMITAFLFYGKLVRSRGMIDWSSLYIGRVFRLTPMYWIVVALMALVAFWHMNFTLTVSLFDVCKSLASWLAFTLFGEPLIDGYNQTSYIPAGAIWTLRYEWAFYFLLPTIALVIRQYGGLQRSRIAAILVAILASKFVRNYSIWGFWLNLGSPFLLGMLCYELTLIPPLTKLARSSAASALVLGSGVGLLITPYLSQWSLFNLLLFTAFFPISAGNTVFGILTLWGSKVLGNASYSIYILHGTVLHVLFQNMPGAASDELGWLWLLLPVVTAAVTAISILLYHAIELPFIQFGKRATEKAPWRNQ